MPQVDNVPYSTEAEINVLGAILVGADIGTLITELDLKPTDFYFNLHKKIYEAAVELYNDNQKIDLVSIDLKLRKIDGYEITALKKLASATVTKYNIEYYAKIVKDMAYRRSVIKMAYDITSAAADTSKPISAVKDVAEQALTSDDNRVEVKPLADILMPAYWNITNAYQNKGQIPGQKMGWTSVDSALGGMDGLIVIGARPGMGKTMFAQNIAEYIAFKEDKNVLFFSLEMSAAQLATRIISSQNYIKYADCKFGTLTVDDFKVMGEFFNGEMSQRFNNIQICDTPYLTVTQIKSIARTYAKKLGKLNAIVIDYIQLIASEGKNINKVEELGRISRSLKLLSKELNCPVIALSQLSRLVETRQEKRPMLSDLRESGAIEQDADSVLLLYREDYYKRDRKNNIAEVIIAKARFAETRTIKLSYQGQIMRFMELDDVKKIKGVDDNES